MIEMKKRNQGSSLLYRLVYVGIFTQVAVIAACVIVHFFPSLPEDIIHTVSSFRRELTFSEPEIQPSGSPTPEIAVSGNSAHQIAVSGNSADSNAADVVDTPDTISGNSSETETDEDFISSDIPEPVSYFVMLDTVMGSMMYYNQGDARWNDYLYGGEDVMSSYGCGPTAVAMLVGSFSEEGGGLSPVEVAEWAAENGFHASESGTYHTMIESAFSHYGLQVESIKELTAENAASYLESGHILVALVKEGTFTQSEGHFILVTKLLENGNVSIADPNSYENTTMEWDLELVVTELKTSAAGGGPLWAVSFKE